jgi:hypothetical protein
MRHFYTVKYFDEKTHSWVCESNSSKVEEKLVFTKDFEPYVGDQISLSYTKPIISEAVDARPESY